MDWGKKESVIEDKDGECVGRAFLTLHSLLVFKGTPNSFICRATSACDVIKLT